VPFKRADVLAAPSRKQGGQLDLFGEGNKYDYPANPAMITAKPETIL
jgi:hypothetical protein